MSSNQQGSKRVPRAVPASGRPKIMPEHRKRLAVLYVRAATDDRAAAAAQRALRVLPQNLGWPKKRIKIIDADIGLSGVSDRRPGFQQLMEWIDRGQVGLVVVSDLSRLSRDPNQLVEFLTKALRAGVLLLMNGRLFDPS